MTEIKKKIKNLDFDFLNEELYSEEFLKKMSEFIPNNEASGKIIYSLLEKIPNYGKDYDWNVGSILQHLSPTQVFKEFKKFDFVLFLNSIGLVWVFGEYNLRNELIVNYLYEVLNNSSSDSAWWKAGFSLGKIRSINPVALLKNSLKSKGLKTLDYYLDNLDKETSIIGILLFSSNLSIKKIIYPKLKLKFLDKINLMN